MLNEAFHPVEDIPESKTVLEAYPALAALVSWQDFPQAKDLKALEPDTVHRVLLLLFGLNTPLNYHKTRQELPTRMRMALVTVGVVPNEQGQYPAVWEEHLLGESMHAELAMMVVDYIQHFCSAQWGLLITLEVEISQMLKRRMTETSDFRDDAQKMKLMDAHEERVTKREKLVLEIMQRDQQVQFLLEDEVKRQTLEELAHTQIPLEDA